MLLSAVYPKAVPKYVKELRESSMKHNFAEAAWNRFKTKGVDLKRILSIEEQCALVQYIAAANNEADARAGDANEDRDFEGMLCTEGEAEFEVRGMFNA